MKGGKDAKAAQPKKPSLTQRLGWVLSPNRRTQNFDRNRLLSCHDSGHSRISGLERDANCSSAVHCWDGTRLCCRCDSTSFHGSQGIGVFCWCRAICARGKAEHARRSSSDRLFLRSCLRSNAMSGAFGKKPKEPAPPSRPTQPNRRLSVAGSSHQSPGGDPSQVGKCEMLSRFLLDPCLPQDPQRHVQGTSAAVRVATHRSGTKESE
jgi:hypothetical protein